jgi:hypothetical protein
LRQPHKLARIVLVMLGQSEEKFVMNRRLLHFDFLCIKCPPRQDFKEWPIGASLSNLSRMY